MLVVTGDVDSNLLDASTSHQAWQTLATLFDSQTAAQEDFPDQQWRDLKKSDSSMIDFVNSVKLLANKFAQIGKPKTAAKINCCFITGLGSDWEPLVLVLALSPSLSAVSTNELSALLLNQEARRSYTGDAPALGYP